MIRDSALEDAKPTRLYEFHQSLNAEFYVQDGWRLPLQYSTGAIAEHHHCRTKACLFDLSHAVQFLLVGKQAAEELECLSPGAFKELRPNKARYTVLTNEQGGIRADMIIANAGDHFFTLMINAMPEQILAFMQAQLSQTKLIELKDQSLIAIEGPLSASIIEQHCPEALQLKFMETLETVIAGAMCRVIRCGLTGEDGFEISAPMDHITEIAKRLLSHQDLKPAGHRALESLRLEAGFKWYGQDFDARISPVEAQIQWVIQKRRLEDTNFPGSRRILEELQGTPSRMLVGIILEGFKPAPAGAAILSAAGETIGTVTSSVFGPTIGAPIAFGYVSSAYSEPGTDVLLQIENKPVAARLAKLPFVPHRFHR